MQRHVGRGEHAPPPPSSSAVRRNNPSAIYYQSKKSNKTAAENDEEGKEDTTDAITNATRRDDGGNSNNNNNNSNGNVRRERVCGVCGSRSHFSHQCKDRYGPVCRSCGTHIQIVTVYCKTMSMTLMKILLRVQ